MPAARHPLRLLVAAVACAATLPLLGAPPAAAEGARSGTPLVGELVQGFADPGPDAHTAGASDEGTLLSWVRTAPGEAVRVPTEDVEDVPAGATIEVTLGGLVRDEASAEGLAPARDVLAAQVVAASEPATAPATGPVNHEVTVVMLQPANSAQDSTTLAQVVDLVNGPVADFWRRESDGAVRFGVVAGHDWTGQPSTVDCSRPFDLWKEAAARARWTSGPGRHLLVYVPWGTRGCAYGLGTVGPAIDSGGMSYVQAAVTSVVAHEFGHNLGLSHAAGLQCDRSVEESGTSACQVDDYGDRYDVMGVSWQQVGSLGAPHAALLGLLPPGSAPSVNAGAPAAEYTLAPLGSRTGTRAVQLTTVDGTRYWLEYRTPTGQDSWLGTPDSWPGLESGVLLRRAISTDNRTSLLLDPTPSAQTGWDGDLAVTMGTGASTSVGRGAFTVTVLEATTSGARVRIGTNGVAHPIDVAYERLGGASVLGEPTGPRVCGLRDGGCRRTYANGALYWTPGTGAHLVQGDIGARWAGLGHEGGWLGYPTTDVVCGLRAGGCYQVFQGGALYWSSATGARAVSGYLWSRWAGLGYEGGWLGYPTTDVVCGLRAGGCYQVFQGGALYWSSATGARAVSGYLWSRWAGLGYEGGWLGYPTTDVVCGLRAGGCYQVFQGGALYWSSATGARAVSGYLWSRWASQGYESGRLGYPTTDVVCGLPGGGCYQRYQGGELYWYP